MTNIPIPIGFRHIKATNEHCKSAQEIIFTVLKEYGFEPELQGADVDLVNLEEYYKDGYFGMIINDLGSFVGAFGLHPLQDQTCKIRKMYLLPEARGKGLGKWMLNFLISQARDLGYARIDLETATRLEKAVQLYREFGFQQSIDENATPDCDLVFYKNL